jgi:hypothetical protein
MLRLEPLLSAEVTLAPPQEFGMTPQGRRRIVQITGGTFAGPRLKGRVLPGGADWQIIREDSAAVLDTRYTLETHDGALIFVQNWGLRHAEPAVMKRLLAGEMVDPSQYYMRTQPRFETGDPRYAWLNKIVCVGSGERLPAAVKLDMYEVK